jgi:hypothetical protein
MESVFSESHHSEHRAPEHRALNPTSKRASVLRVFLERGERGLNCFEAVRLAHDYVLRTTVSELYRYNGIEFKKRYEQVPGHAGSTADCVRYSLTPQGADKARELLGEVLREAA